MVGQISAGGKYSFESENYNWTINFDQKYGKSSESTTFKQPVQIDWQKVRKSTDGKTIYVLFCIIHQST